MVFAKITFGEEFFLANNDFRTVDNICNCADFNGDGNGFFEAIYFGF